MRGIWNSGVGVECSSLRVYELVMDGWMRVGEDEEEEEEEEERNECVFD